MPTSIPRLPTSAAAAPTIGCAPASSSPPKAARSAAVERQEGRMTATYDVSRRTFLSGSTAAAAGLSLGFHIPFGGDAAAAAGTSPEINAWVAVKPDDTVVIRVARVEMGQGSLTGLAQLVAEELEC